MPVIDDTDLKMLREQLEHAEGEADRLTADIERLRAWAEDEQRGRHKAEEDRMNTRSENELLRAALKRHHSYQIDPAYCRSELGRQTEALVGPSGAVFPDEQKASNT